MFPTREQAKIVFGAFLCLRRGVSDGIVAGDTLICFSLPTQRCFSQKTSREEAEKLFSAYAEVFPVPQVASCSYDTFLCLRRGVSSVHFTADYYKDFSLPTQRCFHRKSVRARSFFLFSAYAEVFPFYSQSKRAPPPFLCLRRGVSVKSSETASAASFSLPTQRCFFCGLDCIPPGLLFSAYAEVFPDSPGQSPPRNPFLCLRRGVSR